MYTLAPDPTHAPVGSRTVSYRNLTLSHTLCLLCLSAVWERGTNLSLGMDQGFHADLVRATGSDHPYLGYRHPGNRFVGFHFLVYQGVARRQSWRNLAPSRLGSRFS